MGLVEEGTVVFIVDDDPEVRHAIADLVSIEGYEVRLFSSADAAWTALTVATTRPAIIILDLWINGMSGPEFIRRLRASQQAAVPVLVVSGSRAAEAIESDVDAVIQKPVEATTLVHLIDRFARPPTRLQGIEASSSTKARRPRRAPRPGGKPVASKARTHRGES